MTEKFLVNLEIVVESENSKEAINKVDKFLWENIPKGYIYSVHKAEFLKEGEISKDEKLDIANAMIKYGGSFVKALGHALIHADSINTFKIKTTFYEYWVQYKMMAEEVNKK